MIDGWLAREQVRKAHARGFYLAHVHDAFVFSPKYGNLVRKHYRDSLCELADSNLFQDILSEISGTEIYIDKTTNDLSKYIKESEYTLS